jgi:type IV fimbrial biogenesis protein FimT
MRLLTRAQRGFSLLELLVVMAIIGIMAAAGAPAFSEYLANSKLRAGGDTLLSEALFAQSEAIKRNGTVSVLAAASGTLTTTDLSNGFPGTVLRTRVLPDGVTPSAAVTMNFGSNGRPSTLATSYTVELVKSGQTCSSDVRCPALKVDGGGGVRLCTNKNSCS